MDLNILDLSKLFCTFTSPTGLDNTISVISHRYNILFNKIFVLESSQSDELICTYNIDTNNTNSQNDLLANTILLHRKKETNTLYTINALNTLIKSLNKGLLDKNYIIEWTDYKNSILLTDGSNLRRLNTTIHKIVNL
jgi:hypothetical protein